MTLGIYEAVAPFITTKLSSLSALYFAGTPFHSLYEPDSGPWNGQILEIAHQ